MDVPIPERRQQMTRFVRQYISICFNVFKLTIYNIMHYCFCNVNVCHSAQQLQKPKWCYMLWCATHRVVLASVRIQIEWTYAESQVNIKKVNRSLPSAFFAVASSSRLFLHPILSFILYFFREYFAYVFDNRHRDYRCCCCWCWCCCYTHAEEKVPSDRFQ